MTKYGLMTAIVFAACMQSAGTEVPRHLEEPTGEFLSTWLLCGPFPLSSPTAENENKEHLPGFETDFLREFGGQTNPKIKEGLRVPFEGGEAKWVRHVTETPYVNLDTAVSPGEEICAYAYCEVQSARRQACLLALGSNDGARVWINGEQVWDRVEGGQARVDDHLIPVLLRQGVNTLMIKIEERGGTWNFCCRLIPFGSDAIDKDRRVLFQIENSDEGVPVLRCLVHKARRGDIIKSAELTATLAREPDEVAWSGHWNGENEMPVRVDTTNYDRYVLTIDAELAGAVRHGVSLGFTAGRRVEHTLFKDGKTDYTIVLDKDASESERWAADELRHWLKEVSGADFPIVSDTSRTRTHEIIVGVNARSRALLGPDFSAPDDVDQSFTYRSIGPRILIWGGRQSGTMYGVLTFLEKEMGCRWYTPRVSVAPKRPAYAFTLLRHAESPGLRVRNVFYYEAFDPLWAARNKSNGLLSWGPIREQPGAVESYWRVHTFNNFVPPTEFFDEHPEYFSLIDGKRKSEHAQPCLSNPEVRRIIVKRALDDIRKDPHHLIYSVSQNDGYGPCECDKCQAIVRHEGSEIGPILLLVNQVAKAAEKEFPDKFIGTLAYVYSRKPPKHMRPRENVVIRLCSFECCRSHSLATCEINKAFLNDIQRWSKIASHLYIWDYVVEFSHYVAPLPNFYTLQPNIRLFRDRGAIGVMPQAAYQSRGGEFAELRAYLISKLLWDPDCDVDSVIDDFMYGYYGRSGQFVRAYFDLLQGRVNPERHIRQLRPNDPIFTDTFVRQADALFDQAEVVADNPEVRQRVEMARLPVMYVKCNRAPRDAKRDGTYARFKSIVEREEITHFSERGAPAVKAFFEEMDNIK